MPKISDEPTTKLLAQLYDSDLAYIRSVFGGDRRVNFIIRQIIRTWVTHAKAQAALNIDAREGASAGAEVFEEASEIPENVWDKLLEEAGR